MNRCLVLVHKKMLGLHLVAVTKTFENGLFSGIDVQVILCDFEKCGYIKSHNALGNDCFVFFFCLHLRELFSSKPPKAVKKS